MHGVFKNGCPTLKIKVSGVLSGEKEYIAILDTGFNGHLTLPFTEAFPLGLVLSGIQSSRIADGSLSHHFVCLGKVSCDGKEVQALIDIQPSCDILMGTQLLKAMGKEAVVDFVNYEVTIQDAIKKPEAGKDATLESGKDEK